MKAWQIFVHSLRQVFGNFTAALRVSALIYAAITALALVAGISVGVNVSIGAVPTTENVLLALATAVVALVGTLWIAVGWHRYVLRIEKPGVLPLFQGKRMAAYFGRSFVIGIILALTGAALGAALFEILGNAVIANPLSGMTAVRVVAFQMLIPVPLLMVFYRLATMLPGAALGEAGSFGQGWEATRGANGTMFGLALLTMLIPVGLELIARGLFAPDSLVGLVWAFIFGWVQVMVGVSLLTTLYGHYIEKRALT